MPVEPQGIGTVELLSLSIPPVMASIISGVVIASPVCECELYRLCREARGGLSMNQSIDQSIDRSINQSINQTFISNDSISQHFHNQRW